MGTAAISSLKFKLNTTANYIDELTTDSLNIEYQLGNDENKREALDKLFGNTQANC